MACGCPVVVTDIDGMREVVQSTDGGVLIDEHTPEALGSGIRKILDQPPGRDCTRRYAEAFSWDATSDGQIEIFDRIAASGLVGDPGFVRC
jgi:glycosyltransferase involved in cell wall biosynthesis